MRTSQEVHIQINYFKQHLKNKHMMVLTPPPLPLGAAKAGSLHVNK
jgi:hypothetical protein